MSKFVSLAVVLLLPVIVSAQKIDSRSNSNQNKGNSSPPKTNPGQAETVAAPAGVVIKEVPQIPTEGLVAKVGKGGLTKSEYDFYLLRFANKAGKKVKSLSDEERKTALNNGIDDELVFQDALAEGALNDQYIRFMMTSLFKSKQTVANINPEKFTDEDLKAYYDAHLKEFSTPSEKHIKGARFNSTASAADFIKKLKTAKEPAALPEWTDFGWLAEGKQIVELPSAVSAKVLKLKKGQISEPIQERASSDVCFVFLCSEQKEPVQLSFEEAKGKVKFALVDQKQKENYEALLKKMGFDPKKISEADALFLSALNNGFYREITVRERCISNYLYKKNQKTEQLVPELRKKYPVTIIEDARQSQKQ